MVNVWGGECLGGERLTIKIFIVVKDELYMKLNRLMIHCTEVADGWTVDLILKHTASMKRI